MSDAVDRIAQDLLNLPAPSRARLARRLIESLDEGEDEDVDDLWAQEAELRCPESDEGKVQTLDWDD